jgi:hypothetical protein
MPALKYRMNTHALRRLGRTPILSRFPSRVFLDLQLRTATLALDRREIGACNFNMARNNSVYSLFSNSSLFPAQHGVTAVTRAPREPPAPAVDERNAAEATFRAR